MNVKINRESRLSATIEISNCGNERCSLEFLNLIAFGMQLQSFLCEFAITGSRFEYAKIELDVYLALSIRFAC